MASEKILTLAEVAKLLSVHPITVYRMIKEGRLPAFRIGRVLRFDAVQLEEWLRAKEAKTRAKKPRHKYRTPSSAEYFAYPLGEIFAPEKMLETLAISRPRLVRSFVDAKQTGRRRLSCERCREARKPIAALLLFASEQAKRHWKKAAMPFCRTCFAALRRLATPEASGRTSLTAASKTDRRQTRGEITPRRAR